MLNQRFNLTSRRDRMITLENYIISSQNEERSLQHKYEFDERKIEKKVENEKKYGINFDILEKSC